MAIDTSARIFTTGDLAVLDLLDRAMWVFDVEKPGIVWANREALPLWGVSCVEEIVARDFSDLSESSVQRLAEYMRRLERGEHFHDQWTIYPNGVPTSVQLRASPIRFQNRRISMLITCIPINEEILDHSSLRGVEALRHLPISVCQFDRDGHVIFQNPEALRVFGPADGALGFLPTRFADAIEGDRIWGDVSRGEFIELEAPLETISGTRWFQVTLRQGTDPVSGEPTISFTANDVTERRRTRERLRTAKAEAETANRAKSAFLAAVSHELRTPLTTVLGFSELLADSELTAQQQRYLNTIHSSGSSLRALIDDLIDLARLENESVTLADAPVSLSSLVDQSLNEIRERAEKKGLVLSVHFDESVPRKVRGDPVRIKQVIGHLFDNAVKFTDDGHVSLYVRRIQNQSDAYNDRVWVRIEVEDTGCGIATGDIDRIFEEFTQIDGSYSRAHSGTGLGLTICRLVVERMGGSIGVDSTVGQGSRFWVDLPLKDADPSPRAKDGPKSPSLHILVVEDNPVNQVLVRTVLRQLGHKATIAENGQSALNALDHDDSFDLVFMDIQMPVMDGVATTQEIRARGYSATELPIVALTANLNPDNKVHYLRAGMNACISKPFQVNDIAEVLKQWAHEFTRRAIERSRPAINVPNPD